MKIAKLFTTIKARKTVFIPVMVIVVLAAAGAGYFFWNRGVQKAAAASSAQQTINTARVRVGTLTVSATGSGTLTAGEKTNLAFPIDGVVSTLNVKVGDTVKKGDLLAELQDTSTLQASYVSAETELKAAEQELEDLKNGAATAIAEARLAVADAKEALSDAKTELKSEAITRCDQETTDAYYAAYTKARDSLDALGDGGGSQDYYLTVLVPAKNRASQAYNTYMYCAGFTEYEIASSQANLAIAEASLTEAEENLETLKTNNGLDPTDLADAQNRVASAKIAYQKAAKNLDNASLSAPFDGTILVVNGEQGDEVEAGTFIIIADLKHPEVEFSVDETDMDKVSVGSAAEVEFDAIPDVLFNGIVSRVNPRLESSGNVKVITGVIKLNLDEEGDYLFIEGLSATVEIIKGKTENSLLVPVEAVRDLGDDQYGVFVMDSNGKLRLTMVKVGLMDATSAEILNGLQEGDRVSTGNMETN